MNTLVAATKIQAAFRGHVERKKLNEKNSAATTIQKNYRGHKTRKEMEEKDKAARVIQGNYRSYKEQRKDRPWWKRFCDKCGKVGKKITGAFHKERRPTRLPSFQTKDEEDYKPPLNNPYDENPTPVEDYKVPEGKTLTLLQLSKIYDKKQEQNVDEDKPLKLPPPRLVAGIDAVEGSSGAYQQPKPHKVIKYHAPSPPQSPEKTEPRVEETKPVVEEEGNFFTRLFKPLEIKPVEKQPEEKKPEEQKPEQPNAGEEFFGKFKGLFTRDEKPKEPDVVPLVPSEEKKEGEEGEEGKDEEEEVQGEEEEPQPQEEEKVDILARFQNRFKKEYHIAPERATESKAEPKQEVNEAHAQEEGTFSKFTGLFKTENKETSDTDKDEGNTFSAKFTGLFKKDESDSKGGDSTREKNGNIVTKDNQEEGGFFDKLFKKEEEKPAEVKTESTSEESGIDKMFSIFKKKE
ncbi:cilia- and flagella-associated protein 251-like isoform X2 [Lineus longissimus]|uniref:cilia- and flagella-associated protein 251-like isoform X2 n=1 Tax=Lineus longissimus TaxID=88925 RepID=UPI00315D43CB